MSAGAIAFGADITPADIFDPRTHPLPHDNGLDLAYGYSIWPHYSPSHSETAHDWHRRNGALLCIPEDGGVLLHDNAHYDVGASPSLRLDGTTATESTTTVRRLSHCHRRGR